MNESEEVIQRPELGLFAHESLILHKKHILLDEKRAKLEKPSTH